MLRAQLKMEDQMADFEDGDETKAQQVQRRGGSPTGFETENCRSPQGQLYCLDRAGMMFGFYRRDEANDPDHYAGGIAAILSDYPRSIVEYVTDVRTGVASRIKWPPSPADVKEACEAEMARVRRMRQPEHKFERRRYFKLPDMPGRRANLFMSS